MPTYDEELASVRQSIDALDSRIIELELVEHNR